MPEPASKSGTLSHPLPSLDFTTKATGWRVMEKEGAPHLEDFSIGATTQPLKQVVVVPRVPIEDVGVHEVHSWEPELGLRPGASRASGLECWHLPPSPHTLHPPCLHRLWPPPSPLSFPAPAQGCAASSTPSPLGPESLLGQLALGPTGPLSTFRALDRM